jgi:hypothetical protein
VDLSRREGPRRHHGLRELLLGPIALFVAHLASGRVLRPTQSLLAGLVGSFLKSPHYAFVLLNFVESSFTILVFTFLRDRRIGLTLLCSGLTTAAMTY